MSAYLHFYSLDLVKNPHHLPSNTTSLDATIASASYSLKGWTGTRPVLSLQMRSDGGYSPSFGLVGDEHIRSFMNAMGLPGFVFDDGMTVPVRSLENRSVKVFDLPGLYQPQAVSPS